MLSLLDCSTGFIHYFFIYMAFLTSTLKIKAMLIAMKVHLALSQA